MVSGPRYEPIAEDALLLRFGDTIDAEVNRRVLAATAQLARALPSVECVPAYASVLLRFDPAAWPDEGAATPHARLETVVARILGTAHDRDETGRECVIPVCYGGRFGPDLAAVAAHAHLGEDELQARHAAGSYRVAMIGFAPGFPYLLGMDPRLAMPRRADPRTCVPAGSVAIGGGQTGIYPAALPGGWQIIGRTPCRLFDMRDDPPSRLAPGDRVRFEAIDADRYDALVHGGSA